MESSYAIMLRANAWMIFCWVQKEKFFKFRIWWETINVEKIKLVSALIGSPINIQPLEHH